MDSLYVEKNWDILDQAGLVDYKFCQGKSNYKSACLFYGLFLTVKRDYQLTIHKFGIVQKHRTFKGFDDSKKTVRSFSIFWTDRVKTYHQLCYLELGKNRSMAVLLYRLKWDFVINVKIKLYVITVIIEFEKIKKSKLIYI